MKSLPRLICAAAVAPALLLSSCISPYAGPNETAGGVFGAATGALAGGIIGHQSGSGLEGAAIGGVLGALAGSALGYSQDRYAYGYAPPPPVVRPYYNGYYDYPPPVTYRRHYSYGPRYYGGRCW